MRQKEKGGDKEMIEEEMWKAVSENDVAYDGIFSTQSSPLEFIAAPPVNQKDPNVKMCASLILRIKRELQAFVPVNDAEATF